MATDDDTQPSQRVDPRAEPPAQPTVKMDVVPEWAVAMTNRMLARMGEGFVQVELRLTSQDTKLDKVVTEGIEANVRLDRVETRLTEAEGRVDILEGRAGKTSLRVAGASQVDMEQAAQLAQERAAREDLAKQVAALATTNATQLAILSRLDKVASNPLVKTVCAMLLTALVTWLATHGVQVPK